MTGVLIRSDQASRRADAAVAPAPCWLVLKDQIARVTVMVTLVQLFAQEVSAEFSEVSTVSRQRSFTETRSLMWRQRALL